MCNQLNYVFSGALTMLKSAEVRNVITKNFDYPEKPLKYKHIRRISD